jgi:hypothetical protein
MCFLTATFFVVKEEDGAHAWLSNAKNDDRIAAMPNFIMVDGWILYPGD